MQSPVVRLTVSFINRIGVLQMPLLAKLASVARELRLVAGYQRQEPAATGSIPAAAYNPVINEVTVAESLQQAGITQLPQMLRHPRLAQRQHPGQLGDAALTLRAQGNEPQSDRVGKRFEALNELLGASFHRRRNKPKN